MTVAVQAPAALAAPTGRRRAKSALGSTWWRHVVGVAALIFALFPVWFVLIAAFSESGALSSQTLVPKSVTTRQYG